MALLVLGTVPGWAAGQQDERSADGLKAADRAFAAATSRDRVDGWMRFMAADVVKFAFTGDLPRGSAAMRASMEEDLADPAVQLHWQPTDAGLFRDGGTGFTRGTYTLTRVEAPGRETVMSTGYYLTLWRHDEGRWRVILDTGLPEDNVPGRQAEGQDAGPDDPE